MATPKRKLEHTSIFSYYGGKSKIAHLYSPPIYNTIIEPFAGAAAYSLRHLHLYGCGIVLNDLNPEIAALWRFLTSDAALRLIRERIPYDMKPGTPLSDLVRPDDPEGLRLLIAANMAQGAFGTPGGHRNLVSPFGSQAWSTNDNNSGGLRGRLEYWLPKLPDVNVTQSRYQDIPNQKATWFIDPPYNNAAGALYTKGAKSIDYGHLAEWCRSREGQVIVCENQGATWLPFTPLTDRRIGIYTDSVTSTLGEAVYEQGGDDSGEVGLPFDKDGTDDKKK
jgi:site-specific DNA-adenine methylase